MKTPVKTFSTRRRFWFAQTGAAAVLVLAFALALGCGVTGARAQNVSATWGPNNNSAWYTGGNWVGGSYAGVQGAAATNSNIATFTSAFTGTTVGINFGTNNLNLGAISLDSTRTTATNIGDSSATAGTLRLYGVLVNGVANTIVRNAGSGTLTLQAAQSGVMTLSIGNTTENIINLDGSGSIVISAVIASVSGTTPLTFAGAGTAGRIDITNAANTFTGTIKLTGPEVRFTDAGSYGNVNNTIVVDGGRLATLSSATYTLASTHAIQVGDTAGTSISTPGSGVLTYNGVIADVSGKTGAWAKQGGGTLALGGVSTYTGDTSINNGTLQLTAGNDRLPTGTTVNIGQAASTNLGIFDLNGRNQQIAGLNSTAGTNPSTTAKNTVTSTVAATLTLGGSGTYAYGAGTPANSGVITGAISIVKTGSGTQTLGDANTYTGTTAVNGGTLLVNGINSGTGAVTVNNTGSVLGGTGTIAGATTVNAGANIIGATNGTVGTLTLQSGLAFSGTAGSLASYLVDLSGATSDRLTITGALNLSGTSDRIAFNGTADGTTTYVLASYTTGVAGTFDTVANLPAGYGLVYNAGELDLVPVPEPGTVAAGLLALGTLGYSQRRRVRGFLASRRHRAALPVAA